MNIFWIILIIIAIVIILGILFFLFIAWGFSQGFKNKFGPEWILGELNISFNYFNIDSENKKTIRYLLSENETNEIATQIYNLINDYKKDNFVANSDVLRAQENLWRKSNDETYEYRQMKNDKLKAILLLNSRELIYFK